MFHCSGMPHGAGDSPANLFILGTGVSPLLASLGHTGRRRVVLGHTLNTQTLAKTDEQRKGFK